MYQKIIIFHMSHDCTMPPSSHDLIFSPSRSGWSVNSDASFPFYSSATRKASKFDPWTTTHPNTATISAGWTSRAWTRPRPLLVSPGSSREETVTSVKRGAGSSLHSNQWHQREAAQSKSPIMIGQKRGDVKRTFLNIPFIFSLSLIPRSVF